MPSDKRKPKLKKIGCFYSQGNGDTGFEFFEFNEKVKNGDTFIFSKGILWKIVGE